MPNRVIREGLLDSPRYWSVSDEARLLFVHLMLLADDFGLVSLAPVFVRRRAFSEPPAPVRIDKLLGELQKADLLRIYQVNGMKFGFIPRFRQTLRIEKAKHPMPPPESFEDDPHAKEKFSKNKAMFEKMQCSRSADAVHVQRTRHAEVKRSEIEVKGNEENRNEGKGGAEGNPAITPAPAAQEHAATPVLQEEVKDKTVRQWARDLGITQRPSESRSQFEKRIEGEIRGQAQAGHPGARAWLTSQEGTA